MIEALFSRTPTNIIVSVVFQWTIPYMISPDSANLGVKAIYVWAGLLVPVIIILYFFYPEVSVVLKTSQKSY